MPRSPSGRVQLLRPRIVGSTAMAVAVDPEYQMGNSAAMRRLMVS